MMKRVVLAILIALFDIAAPAAPIRLAAKTIIPEKEAKEQATASKIILASSQSSNPSERGIYLIQHDGKITPEWRQVLIDLGATVHSYIPDNAYLIEASYEECLNIASNMDYSYLGEFKPEYKYAPSIYDTTTVNITSTGKTAESGNVKIYDVLLFHESSRDAVIEKINSLDGCEVEVADGMVIRASLTTSAIRIISSLSDVHWIENFEMPTLCNNVAVQSPRMNVETVWPNGTSSLGLSGEGQIIAVADTGLDNGDLKSVHSDVRDRIVAVYARGRTNDWSDPNGHGTHVVGSALGNGSSSNGKVKGVAYGAKLVFQSTLDSSGGLGGIPSDLTVLFDQAYKAGARIHSNSWGTGRLSDFSAKYLGSYAIEARQIDSYMFNNPDFLILFAAGNDGIDLYPADGVIDEDSIGAESTAKNCITVGGTENYRTSGGLASYQFTWYNWIPGKFNKPVRIFPKDPIASDYSTLDPNGGTIQGMIPWSSRGPCDDGRIKPDIVAPGHQVLSMLSSVAETSEETYYDQYYQYLQGTSMSCPLVAGGAALARQWLNECHDITNPDGATIKALLLAGAKSLSPGQYGMGQYREIPSAYPNNVEGWGQANIGNALQNENGILVHDARVIAQGETQTYRIKVLSGNALSIVMAYTDYPGDPSSGGEKLVNDLDLSVETPSGTKIYPNSKTSPDRLNNVEGIRLKGTETQTGVYTITVSGYSIPQPMSTSLTGGKPGSLRYSLVVNGATEEKEEPAEVLKPELEFVVYNNWPAHTYLSASSSSLIRETTFVEGDEIYLYSYFKNTGKANADEFAVSLKLFDSTGSIISQNNANRTALVVGQGGGFNGSAISMLQGLEPGAYTLVVTLDSDEEVGETTESNNSTALSFTVTKKIIPVTDAPTSCKVTTSGNSLFVSWTAVPGAVSYNLYRATTSQNNGSVFARVTDSVAYLDEAVDVGTTYYYWVAGVNSEGVEGAFAGPTTGKVEVWLTLDDSSNRTFDAVGGTGRCQVSANTSWTASSDAMWVRLEPCSGTSGKTTLVFVVDASNEITDRVAEITIVSQDAAVTGSIIVEQAGIHANESLSQALDNPALPFWTGGDSAWVDICTEEVFSSSGAYARSGTLASGQTGWIETVVSGTGTLQFRYSLSAISGGALTLYVDGIKKTTLSTLSGAWKYHTLDITSSGTHTIRWTYTQNLGTSFAMIDDISFASGCRPKLPDTYTVESGVDGISLNWVCYDTSVASFNVYRSTSTTSANPEKIAMVSPGGSQIRPTMSYEDKSGIPGIVYYYWVEAVNPYGTSICAPIPGQIENPSVILQMTEMHLPAVVASGSRGQTNVAYNANIEFYAVSDVDWIQFSFVPDRNFSGNMWKMVFTVSANTNALARYGTILLYADEDCTEQIGSLSITQDGMPRNPSPLTWYVSADNGDDDNKGSSQESPKKTIQAAINAAYAGDIIIVNDGTYSGKIAIDKVDMTIKSLNGPQKTRIQMPSPGRSGPAIYSYDRSNNIEGFYVDGRQCYSYHGGCVQSGTLRRCVITGGAGAAYGGGANGSTLISCAIFGNDASYGGGTYSCALTNCTVWGNCASKGGGGTYGGSSANTIVWSNTNSVGEVSNVKNGTHVYCCSYPEVEIGEGNIADDPLLTAVGGFYSLGSLSPCIGGGKNIYTAGEMDLQGNPRIGNGHVDIGAIEDLTVVPASSGGSVRAASTHCITIDIEHSSRAAEYHVYRSDTPSHRPDEPHAVIVATGEKTIVFEDGDDIVPGMEYWYWISAVNEAGSSPVASVGKGYSLPMLSLGKTSFSFDGEGGYGEVDVKSDANWVANAQEEWIEISPGAGSGDSLLAISSGRGNKIAREGLIFVIAGYGTAHTVTNEILVAQEAAPPIINTITFNPNGGTGKMDALASSDGAAVTLTSNTFVRVGYTFSGWSLSAEGGAFYSDGQTITPASSVILFAVWKANAYTVVFHANDGTMRTASQLFEYGTTTGLKVNQYSRLGYAFSGWSTSENGTPVYEDGADVLNLTAIDNGHVNLYATWAALPTTAPMFKALSSSGNGISLVVNAAANATSYVVYRSQGTECPSEKYDEVSVEDYGESTFEYDDFAAEPGVEYSYWIAAASPAGVSEVVYCGRTYRLVVLAIGAQEISYEAGGGSEDIAVMSNAEWETETNDVWIAVARSLTVVDAAELTSIRVSVDKTDAARNGSVVIVAAGDTQHPVRATLAVKQEGEIVVPNPVITPADGSVFYEDRCVVAISCANEDATIYYAVGAAETTPKTTDRYRYAGPFEISTNCVVKAIAVYANRKSGYTVSKIQKSSLTLAAAAGVRAFAISTGGSANWTPIVDPTSPTGFSAKSGSILDGEKTWLRLELDGEGTLTFCSKVSCERDDDGAKSWDSLRVYVDTIDMEDDFADDFALRLDGESGWVENTITIAEAGSHFVLWCYAKDEEGEEGDDCAWISGVVWTPCGGIIPVLEDNASADKVNAAVEGVEFVDDRVKDVIGGDISEYNAFRIWAVGVPGGESNVIGSENAAVSYLLGAEKVFDSAPKIEFEAIDVATASGEMALLISVRDGEQVVKVASEKVIEMFEATNDIGDWESENKKLVPTVTETKENADKSISFKVKPGDGTSTRAFLRIRR